MNLPTILVAVIVGGIFIAIIASALRKKKQGKSGCAGCAGGCSCAGSSTHQTCHHS